VSIFNFVECDDGDKQVEVGVGGSHQLELVHVESCFKVFASGCGDSPQDMCKPLQGTAVKGGQTSFSRSVHMVSCPSISSRTIVRESWTVLHSSWHTHDYIEIMSTHRQCRSQVISTYAG